MRRSRPHAVATQPWAWRLAALVMLSAATLLASRAAHAELTPMNESELSTVRGQGPIDTRREQKLPELPGLAGLLASSLSPSDLHLSFIDKPALDSVLAASGMTLDGKLYDGGAIMKIAIAAAPFDLSFDASKLFLANTGLEYHGASMGTVTLHNVDMRGTTLYVFSH